MDDFLEDPTFRDWVLQEDSFYRQKWEVFQREHPEMKTEIQLARAVILELKMDKVKWDQSGKEITKKAIFDRIAANKQEEGGRTVLVGAQGYRIGWVRTAVAILLLLGVGGVAWFGQQAGTPQQVALEPEWIERSNHAGQKSIVHLPDGSKVVLNAASTICYPQDFGKTSRKLLLSGEAFFDVRKDASNPFSVVTGSVTTTALGTSFSITAFDEMHPSVKLATGMVEIKRQQENNEAVIRLNPGEEAFLNVADQMEKRNFDPSVAFLWKEGILFFDRTPFPEVVEILERWYAVEIEVRHSPKNTPSLVSGRFDNDHLDNVLESIGYSLRFSHEIDQKKVVIDFQ